VDRYGKTRWTYDAGQWVNAVAVSPDATVIAAGGLDGTVYLFDRTGRMTTQKKMDSNIRPRSLAVSRDGTRIAVADQNQLYGLTVLGDADPGVMETFTPAPLDPVKAWGTSETATPAPTTIIPTTTEMVVVTPVPPTPTQKSPAGVLPVLTGLAMTGIMVAMRRR
jgi:WD40 repeat protein